MKKLTTLSAIVIAAVLIGVGAVQALAIMHRLTGNASTSSIDLRVNVSESTDGLRGKVTLERDVEAGLNKMVAGVDMSLFTNSQATVSGVAKVRNTDGVWSDGSYYLHVIDGATDKVMAFVCNESCQIWSFYEPVLKGSLSVD